MSISLREQKPQHEGTAYRPPRLLASPREGRVIAQILLVEDDDNLRAAIKDWLELARHRVIEASDGAQAFAMAEEYLPHLIIMDVVMPGLYGSTAAKKLQEYLKTKDIPIIIISGSVEKQVLGELAERPNVRFLPKPVDMDKLKRTIKELLPKGGYTQ